MKPRTIGIVGGAGPLAGSLLLQRVFSQAGSVYGCYRDADFPEVLLLSFPFSNMLSPDCNEILVKEELAQALHRLKTYGASVLAIACNTLHAFLDENKDIEGLIHLPKMLAEVIPASLAPLVLCTSMAARYKLHQRFFACQYPEDTMQLRIDRLIEKILQGERQEVLLLELQEIIESQRTHTIILGCTELSMFSTSLAIPHKLIIDPLEIMVSRLLEESFLGVVSDAVCRN